MSTFNSSHVLEVNYRFRINFACFDEFVELILKSEFFTLLPIGVSKTEDNYSTNASSLNMILKSFFREVAFHVNSRAYSDVVLATIFLRELLYSLSEPYFVAIFVEAAGLGFLYEVLCGVHSVNFCETTRMK